MKRLTFFALTTMVLAGCQETTQPDVADSPDASVSQPVRVAIGGFDVSRGGSYSFPSGAFLDEARASLAANFPGVRFSSFSTLTRVALAGVDILMLSSAASNNSLITPLSAAEQDALVDFLQRRGCAILFPDNIGFSGGPNESLLDPFGMSIAGVLAGTVIATVTDPAASPITSGPFGTISSFSQPVPGGLTNLGPFATSLATNALGDALAVIESRAITPGSGPVVVYTDVNSFGDADAVGLFSQNEALFLNTINFCSKAKL